MPAATIHTARFLFIIAEYSKFLNTFAESSHLSPNKPKACSDIGNTSTPSVFCCVKLIKNPCPSIYSISPQTSFSISENLSPVKKVQILS
jgi:hypothetical protein